MTNINAFDFRRGDIVQIRSGENAGRLARVDHITAARNGNFLVYTLELVDENGGKEYRQVTRASLTFVSREE